VLGAFLCLAVPLKVDFKKHLHKNIALLPYFSSVPKKKKSFMLQTCKLMRTSCYILFIYSALINHILERYVGNIHLQVTDTLLQEVFQSIGPVEGCKLIRKEKVDLSFF